MRTCIHYIFCPAEQKCTCAHKWLAYERDECTQLPSDTFTAVGACLFKDSDRGFREWAGDLNPGSQTVCDTVGACLLIVVAQPLHLMRLVTLPPPRFCNPQSSVYHDISLFAFKITHPITQNPKLKALPLDTSNLYNPKYLTSNPKPNT